MTDNRQTAWPRSWPPFWRAALHIAIATAAGNVVLAAGVAVALSDSLKGIHDTAVFAVLAIAVQAATILLVLALALLGRANRQIIVALLVAFFLGTLVMELPVLYAFGPWITGLDVCRGEFAKLVGGKMAAILLDYCFAPFFMFLLGSSVICARFARSFPRSSPRRFYAAWIAGTLLLWGSAIWARAFLCEFRVHESHYQHLFGTFLGDLYGWTSAFVLFPLAYAIAARMLISSIEEHEHGQASGENHAG